MKPLYCLPHMSSTIHVHACRQMKKLSLKGSYRCNTVFTYANWVSNECQNNQIWIQETMLQQSLELYTYHFYELAFNDRLHRIPLKVFFFTYTVHTVYLHGLCIFFNKFKCFVSAHWHSFTVQGQITQHSTTKIPWSFKSAIFEICAHL